MKKILIATTNPGKFHEFTAEYADVPIKFVSLNDLSLDKIELDEPYDTLWQNAWHKAKYFAIKTGLPTIAEDTGFFVDHLGGEPGIQAKRYAPTASGRIERILNNLKGVPAQKRGAHFQTNACFYDPQNESFTMFSGKVMGRVVQKLSGNFRDGMDYDAIFYYPPLKKIFSQLSILEKNNVSHRGQVIHQIKHFITRHYAGRQVVASVAMIVKDRRLLMTRRRDHRPEFDGRWEFPGGMVEYGEQPSTAVLREAKEETGYNTKVILPIPGIYSKWEKKYNYQVFLSVYLCRPISGKFRVSDHETSEAGWFTLSQSLKKKLLPLNHSIIKDNFKILSKYID